MPETVLCCNDLPHLTVTLHHILRDRHYPDPRWTSAVATTAGDTAELSPAFDIRYQLVVNPSPGAQSFGTERVVSAGFAHEGVKLAGIPDPAALGAIFTGSILNAEAVAGWTDQVAAAAEDAAISDFRPELIRHLVFHKQPTGLLQQVRLASIAVAEFAQLSQPLTVAIGEIE